jgi:hypothetical protein
MRVAVFAFVSIVALALGSLTAEAVSSGSGAIGSGRTQAGANTYYQEVAQGCGPGFH